MKNNHIKDERIAQIQNKVFSELYIIFMIFLAGSILIKEYIVKSGYTSYLTELILILLSIVFLSIRSAMLGGELVHSSRKSKTAAVVGSLMASVIISVISSYGNYQTYQDQYSGLFDGHFMAVVAINFFSNLIFISAIVSIFYISNYFGHKQTEKKIK